MEIRSRDYSDGLAQDFPEVNRKNWQVTSDSAGVLCSQVRQLPLAKSSSEVRDRNQLMAKDHVKAGSSIGIHADSPTVDVWGERPIESFHRTSRVGNGKK